MSNYYANSIQIKCLKFEVPKVPKVQGTKWPS